MPPPGAKARAQKLEAQKAKDEANRQRNAAQEDKKWVAGSNKKAADRDAAAAEKERKIAEKAAAKKEAEAADEAELSAMRTKPGKARKAAGVKKKKKKNDMDLLDAFLAEEDAAKKKKEKKKASSTSQAGLISQDDMLKPNLNRQRGDAAAQGDIDASGLDSALAALGVGEKKPGEKGPSRKAAYSAFEEREMARLKEENPGLKRSQLKDKIFALWKKSPENPENQQD